LLATRTAPATSAEETALRLAGKIRVSDTTDKFGNFFMGAKPERKLT